MNESNYCQCEETQTLAPSYMVHVAGKPAPTVYHFDLQEAVAEATRLARKEQREVAILQTIAVATPQEQPVEWTFADNVHRNPAPSLEEDASEEWVRAARAACDKIVEELLGSR